MWREVEGRWSWGRQGWEEMQVLTGGQCPIFLLTLHFQFYHWKLKWGDWVFSRILRMRDYIDRKEVTSPNMTSRTSCRPCHVVSGWWIPWRERVVVILLTVIPFFLLKERETQKRRGSSSSTQIESDFCDYLIWDSSWGQVHPSQTKGYNLAKHQNGYEYEENSFSLW